MISLERKLEILDNLHNVYFCNNLKDREEEYYYNSFTFDEKEVANTERRNIKLEKIIESI